MGEILDEANSVYADGPTISPARPSKAEIRGLFKIVEENLDSLDVRIDDLVTGVAAKAPSTPVRLLTTSAVSPTTDMEAGDTYDGETLVEGDRVARAVSPADEFNGVWIVPASGAATRAADADSAAELYLLNFFVSEGTHAGEMWLCPTADVDVGTDPIELRKIRDAVDYGDLGAEIEDARDEFDTLDDRLNAISGDPAGDIPGFQSLSTYDDDAEQVRFAFDDQGRLVAEIHPDSLNPHETDGRLPGVSSMRTDESGTYVLSYVDETSGYVDCSQPTPEPKPGNWIEPAGYTAVPGGSNWIADNMGNWWIRTAIQWRQFDYFGGLGMSDRFPGSTPTDDPNEVSPAEAEPAPLYLNQQIYGSGAYEHIRIGSDVTNDDHDMPAPLVDPRAGAKYPLQVFQCGHGGVSNIRQWRSSTRDGKMLSSDRRITTQGVLTYPQPLLHPTLWGEIWLFHRIEGTAYGTVWAVTRSADGGDTWDDPLPVFQGGNIYLITVPTIDGTGIMCFFNYHPTGTDARVVRMVKLTWGGEVSSFTGGVLAEDIYDALFEPVDVITDGDAIYDGDANHKLRMTHAAETSDGFFEVVFAEWQTSPSLDLSTSVLKHARVDATGVSPSVAVKDVCSAGLGTTDDSSFYYYIGGGSVLAANHVLACRWDAPDAPNRGVAAIYDMSGSSAVEVAEIERTSDRLFTPITFNEVWLDAAGAVRYRLGSKALYFKGRRKDLGVYRAGTRIIEIGDFL